METENLFLWLLAILVALLILTTLYRYIFRINYICKQLEEQNKYLKIISEKIEPKEETENKN